MKRITILLIVFTLFSAAFIPAQEITEGDIEFEFISEDELGLYRIIIPGMDNAVLKSASEPGRNEKTVIARFYNELSLIEGLEVKHASIIFNETGFEAVLVPEKFIIDETDYAPYLPAGLSFIHRTFTMYDFRMLKDRFFVRIRGEYFSPEDLFGKMKAAYDDPVKYIVSHNPEYIVNQLGKIDIENSSRDSSIDKLQKDLESLSESHKNLMEQHENLMEDYDKLKFAFIAAVRKGIYGSKKPVAQETIDKVLSIKKTNPSYTYAEIYTELKSQGIKISKGKVALILNTYLGDF